MRPIIGRDFLFCLVHMSISIYSYQRSSIVPLPRRSIFVIDDDLGMLRTIDRLLRLYGFHVQTFSSAEEFLKASSPCDVGLLVLDIQLSGMSGIELRQKLAL